MIVPKLRFTGFNEPWSETSLGKISSFITSGSRDWAQYYSDCGDKFIRMTNLVRDGITLNLSDLKFVRLPENSNEGKRTALQHHDILISITAELGKLGWVPDNLGTAYINQHTALVRPNLSITSSKFVANLLSTKKYNNILNQQNDSGAKSGLNLSTIKNFGFYAPNKIEQTKISDFLSSVDEKITLLNKQYDLLCQYKKGMMQKIFSQELRFKDENGEEFPEWNYDEISSLFSNKSKKYNPLSGINYPCIEMDCISQRDGQLLTTLDSSQQQSIKNIFKKGDVLFGKLRPYLRKYILATFDGVCSSEIWVFKGILMKNSYLYQFVQTDFFINLANKSTGSKMPRADWDTISSTFVFYPCLEEQSKIANFLSSLDDKIAAKKAELDKLKTWKQGLLQQMFI